MSEPAYQLVKVFETNALPARLRWVVVNYLQQVDGGRPGDLFEWEVLGTGGRSAERATIDDYLVFLGARYGEHVILRYST